MTPQSFADPETHFEFVVSDTPRTVDGFKPGEPIGEVRCGQCGAVAENVDEIPHRPQCPQRWVRSRWWAERFRDQ